MTTTLLPGVLRAAARNVGHGTTDVAVFVQGAIRHTAVIPIAGDQLTNDIAIALRTVSPIFANLAWPESRSPIGRWVCCLLLEWDLSSCFSFYRKPVRIL